MPDEKKEEKTTTEVSAADLATAINALAAKVEAMSVSQSHDAALAEGESRLRDRAEGADPAKMEKLAAEMEALEKRHKEDTRRLEELRRNTDARKSSYSLGEAMQKVEDEGRVCRAETVDFWRGVGNRAVADGMGPTEILIRGAYEARAVETPYGDGARVARNFGIAGLTAGSDDPVLRAAQQETDAMFYWMLKRDAQKRAYRSIAECPWYESRYRPAMEALGRSLPASTSVERAMTATTLANWVPTGFSASVIEHFELARNLLRFIPFYQMSQNPESITRESTYLTPYKHVSSASDSESITPKITTTGLTAGRLLLNLHQFVFRVPFDIESEEDVYPNFMARLTATIGRSRAYWLEHAVCNSSDAVIPVPGHIDVDVTSSASVLNMWQGLRPMALAQSYTTSLATFNGDTAVSTMHSKMGKYSGDPNQLILICGAKGKTKFKLLKDSSGNPLVVVAGTAPITTGVPVNSVDGSPLVVVESWRENVNASGFYDGTTTNQATVMWLNRQGVVLAARNQAGRTYTSFNTETAQNEILVHDRFEMEDNYDVSTEHFMDLGVGVTF